MSERREGRLKDIAQLYQSVPGMASTRQSQDAYAESALAGAEALRLVRDLLQIDWTAHGALAREKQIIAEMRALLAQESQR